MPRFFGAFSFFPGFRNMDFSWQIGSLKKVTIFSNECLLDFPYIEAVHCVFVLTCARWILLLVIRSPFILL